MITITLPLYHYLFLGAAPYTDRVGRDIRRGDGSRIDITNLRVTFKNPRPNNRNMSRNLALTNLDEDIPMIGDSNNNTRQVILNLRDRGDRAWRTGSYGRNNPMPNRNFKGSQLGLRSQPLPLTECSWYKILVSIYICNYIVSIILIYYHTYIDFE